jgi:hypothetical protein
VTVATHRDQSARPKSRELRNALYSTPYQTVLSLEFGAAMLARGSGEEKLDNHDVEEILHDYSK